MAIRLARDAKLVRFSSSDGLQIEGRLIRRDRDRAVVLCHPHPLHGGSMLTPVIMTAEQVFQESGYTTLIFNFRGVGGSEGAYGEGRAEAADVTGGLSFLEETLGGAPRLQAVAGYSFGSFVGGSVAASDPRVGLYLGIAPPLNAYDFEFLKAAMCAIALIGGKRDEFCEMEKLQSLYLRLPASPWLRLLDTDHFFTGAMDELAQACRDVILWAEPKPPPKRP
jgi:uncharacterized protein